MSYLDLYLKVRDLDFALHSTDIEIYIYIYTFTCHVGIPALQHVHTTAGCIFAFPHAQAHVFYLDLSRSLSLHYLTSPRAPCWKKEAAKKIYSVGGCERPPLSYTCLSILFYL